MADEPVVNPEPQVSETPPAPQVEAVDSEGVPFKNRYEEYRRKYEAEQQLNARYQQELGQRMYQPPPQPQRTDELDSSFDEQSRKFVDKRAEAIAQRIAEQTAYKIIERARLTQEISTDQDLQKAANEEYANLNSHPMYKDLSQEVKESFAISQAKAKVLAQRLEAAKKGVVTQAHSSAVAAQAAGASLPQTGSGQPSNSSKDAYIREFINDPQQRSYCKKMWKLDPDSTEGRAKLAQVAEYAWKGSPVSEKFAQAVEMVKRGA